MIFSAATFLYLLPLAGLPIVFHLALKQKRRRVVFSTLMFFHRTDPRLNSRRQIRQWLLLLMRVLMLLLFLLALSRPSVRLRGDVGGKLSVVAIVDNSGSMSAASEQDGVTKLERATEGARRLFSSLPDNAEGTLVMLVDDPAVQAPEALTTDREALFQCLDAVRPTEATGDASRALSQAFRFLRGSAAGGGVVHVFTDLQETEWGPTSHRFDTAEARTSVVFHRVGTPPRARANIVVAGVQYPERRALLGQPYHVGLAVRNESDTAGEIRVHSLDAHGEKSTESVMMSGHEVRTVRISATIRKAGHHWVRAWIEGDDFAGDNAAGIGLSCDGLATVRFIGQPDEYGMLPMALSPTGQGRLTGLTTQFGPPGSYNRDANEPAPVLIVTTWDRLESDARDAASLQAHVEEGGNLLIAPSVRPSRRVAGERMPAWLGASTRPRQAYAAGVRLQPAGRDNRFWREIGRDGAAGTWFVAYAFQPLDLSSAFTPLLTAGSDRVVLAHRPLGRGNLFVSGTAFSARWNTLPLSGFGVVMAQYMAAAGTSSPTTNRISVVAGESPRPPAAAASEVQIVSLVGDSLEWKGPPNRLPVLARAGVYLMKSGAEEHSISVRASEKEGLHEFVEEAVLPVMGPIAHTVTSLDRDPDFARFHRHQARALELFVPLLLLATLAVLVEGFLGAPRTLRTRHGRVNADNAGSGPERSALLAEHPGLRSVLAVLQRPGRSGETDGADAQTVATGRREA